MDPREPPDVFCPRCGYNLRGLPLPRCPECGLTQPEDAWRTGVLRESIPTTLDRCDPWQPHQVLLRSLWELIRGTLAPRRLVTTLDLDGPLTRAALMLAFGGLWLYALTTLVLAAATFLHAGTSPAAALRSAALYWTPRVAIVALTVALLTLGIVSHPSVTRLARPSARRTLRLAACWLPVSAAHVSIPLTLLLLVCPSFIEGLTYLPPLVGGLLSLTALRRRGPRPPAGSTRTATVLALLCFLAWCLATPVLAHFLLPTSLDPPLWIYF